MKSYTLEPTKHPDLFRVVDRDGDWKHYFHKPTSLYLDGVTSILGGGYAKGPGFLQYLMNTPKEEREANLSEAIDRGEIVHRYIDLILTYEGEPMAITREMQVFAREGDTERTLTNKEWDCMLAFARFWNAHDPILYTSEAPLFSIKGRYAGTTDAFMELTKACKVKMCGCEPLIGKIGAWDWKSRTSKSGVEIYGSTLSQAAAYAFADNVQEYAPKKPDYAAIALFGTRHTTTGGYKFEAIEGQDLKEAYGRFRSARNIYAYESPTFDPTKEIQDIPDSFTITVRRTKPPEEPPEPEVAPEGVEPDIVPEEASQESESTTNTTPTNG